MKYLIPLVIALIVIITIYIAIRKIKRAIRRSISRASRGLFNGASASVIKSVLDQVNEETAETPKSLSNLESVYLPMILREFPDLQIDVLRNKTGLVLKEYFDSVHRKVPTDGLLGLASKSLCDTVSLASGEKYNNSPFIFHKAVISSFEAGKIRFDVAFKTDVQRRGSVSFTQMKEVREEKASQYTCNSCGAPLTKEAQKSGQCSYCGVMFKDASAFEWLAVEIYVR